MEGTACAKALGPRRAQCEGMERKPMCEPSFVLIYRNGVLEACRSPLVPMKTKFSTHRKGSKGLSQPWSTRQRAIAVVENPGKIQASEV